MKKSTAQRPSPEPHQPTGKQQGKVIDTGRLNRQIYEPDEEISKAFSEAQRIAESGSDLIKRKLRAEINSDVTPELAGDDPDANWTEAGTSGDESVVGGNSTPDQDNVEIIGEAVGLQYEDNEPLHTLEKIEERDRHRWELDPASSEDYINRVKRPS
ncbi:MAG: DUF6335 family protein [Acidobacteriota bacterium]